MNDRDIESLLRRYRPVAQISKSPNFHISKSARTWPWAVAAAALLAVSIGLHAAAARGPETVSLVDGARVQAIVNELGGTPERRIMAEWIARREATLERDRLARKLGAEAARQ
jgi:hypothetical protein